MKTFKKRYQNAKLLHEGDLNSYHLDIKLSKSKTRIYLDVKKALYILSRKLNRVDYIELCHLIKGESEYEVIQRRSTENSFS